MRDFSKYHVLQAPRCSYTSAFLVTWATPSVGLRGPLQITDRPWGRECTWLRARRELARTHFAHIFHRRSQGGTHRPTHQHIESSPNDRRWWWFCAWSHGWSHRSWNGFDDLRLSLMLIRLCHNRQDNEGAILNLPNLMQLPSQFPIVPPFLHKDDGITLINQDWIFNFSVRGEKLRRKYFFAATCLAGPPMSSNVRGVFCLFFSVCFSVLLTGISFTDD